MPGVFCQSAQLAFWQVVGILAGAQHSALLVVVACFYSFEHSSPNLCPALYLVHAHYLIYQLGQGVGWIAYWPPICLGMS